MPLKIKHCLKCVFGNIRYISLYNIHGVKAPICVEDLVQKGQSAGDPEEALSASGVLSSRNSSKTDTKHGFPLISFCTHFVNSATFEIIC